MPLSLYEASVPVFGQMLTSLAAVLDKAIAHETAKKLDSAVLPAMRLYPDMLPLSRQIMIGGDFAKNTLARLAGTPIVPFPDDERTLAELRIRVGRALDLVSATSAAALDGREDSAVEFTVAGRAVTMRGRIYLLNYAMPNFYFHVTTAYAILRHAGVEIGKRDFIGQPPV